MYVEPRSTNKRTWIALAGVLLVAGVIGSVALLRSSPSVSAITLINNQIELQEFESFMMKYKKQYTAEEKLNRFETYKINKAYILAFNSLQKDWKLEINEFADMTFKEFKNERFPGKMADNANLRMEEELEEYNYPSTVDWRQKGAVTPVKNQGQCGSCWSFSTTGSIEGAEAIAGRGLKSLSEQQLVDCSGSYGNNGCGGGLMDYGFEYIISNGITSESIYPYTARDGSCNRSEASDVVARISNYRDVSRYSSSALKTAIAKGPVSVAVEADQSAFQFYSSGIVTSGCGTSLDHGVLAVGYGSDYYIVKNSWGASWGDSGYIKLGVEIGAGVCGIQMQPSYPVV